MLLAPTALRLASRHLAAFSPTCGAGHQRSKPGGAKPSLRLTCGEGGAGGAAAPAPLVLHFLSEPDRDAFSDALARRLACVRAGAAPAGAAGGGAGEAHAQVARAALLATNADVRALHAQLVVTGVVPAADFWASQQDLLQDATSRRALGQRPGLPNALLSAVRAEQDGRSKKVNFTLSKEQIAQIFAEHSAVRAAYLRHVRPAGALTDLQFWTKYCKVQYFRQARRGGAPENEEEAADLAMFAEDEAAAAAQAAAAARHVDARFNLAHAAADPGLGRGWGAAREDGGRAAGGAPAGGPSARVVRDINRHAAVVLAGCPDALCEDRLQLAQEAARRADAGRPGGRGELTAQELQQAAAESTLEDLVHPVAAHTVELRIQDARRYFEAAAAAGGAATAPEGIPHAQPGGHAAACWAAEARRVGSGRVTCPGVSSSLAHKVLADLGHAAGLAAHSLQGSAAADGGVPAAAQAAFADEARTAKALLRLYWKDAPAAGQRHAHQRRAQWDKIRGALSALYDSLEARKAALQPAQRHNAAQQLRPLLAALDATFEHSDAIGAPRVESCSGWAEGSSAAAPMVID